MYRFAHLSDLHLSPVPLPHWREATAKRALGLTNWHMRRKSHHRADVLAALKDDLAEFAPEHLAITGDLTNLGLKGEIDAAARFLDTLAPPEQISLVPGNHDIYAGESASLVQQSWQRFMGAGFPYLHRRGPISFIGVSSGVPTRIGRATGRIGKDQLVKLEALLAVEGSCGRYRVVLIHHPPQENAAPGHKHLDDRKEFRTMLSRAGAELVLHGHMHTPLHASLAGPEREIPVLGVGSASYDGHGGHPPAHYHRLSLDGALEDRRLVVEHRHYDPHSGRFAAAAAGEKEPAGTV